VIWGFWNRSGEYPNSRAKEGMIEVILQSRKKVENVQRMR